MLNLYQTAEVLWYSSVFLGGICELCELGSAQQCSKSAWSSRLAFWVPCQEFLSYCWCVWLVLTYLIAWLSSCSSVWWFVKISHCSTRAGGCGANSAGGGDDSRFVRWLGHSSLSTLCTSPWAAPSLPAGCFDRRTEVVVRFFSS